MKTNRRIQTWLRYAAALLLVVTGCLTTQAQEIEGGEAFYIYQNDGHFDGFFYDQVKQINYSRYDTRGVEYDQYVSQEIVTEDSVYRIMLSAIDSVSFVQPEIKFAKEVRFMHDEGMMAYYQSISIPDEDTFLLRFSGSMPSTLQPKVGDVLSCPDLKDYDEAFVGKVKKVRTDGSDLVVECGYIDDLKDVFDQFITVEQVHNVQTPEGSRTYRRIAGLEPRNRAEGNIDDLTLFDFNTTFEGDYNFNNNLKFMLEAKIGFAMAVSAAYKITLDEIYIKTELKEQFSLGFTFSLDGRIEGSLDMTVIPGVGKLIERFSKIPFPAAFPILYANVTPQPFTRAEAHLNLGMSTGVQVKAISQSLELMSQWPYVRMKAGSLPLPFLPSPFEVGGEFKFNAELNGMVQTGMKFPIEVGTEDWIKRVTKLKAGATVYAGPKASGALDLKNLVFDDGIYDKMKDTKVELALMSIDTELAAVASVWSQKAETKTTHNASFGKYEMTLFPKIEDMECEITGEKMNEVKVKYDVEGNVFLPQMLGVGLYRPANKDDEKFTKLAKWDYVYNTYFINTFDEAEVTIKDVEPGIYMVRPIIKLGVPIFGEANTIVPVYGEEEQITIASEEMILNPAEIEAEEVGGNYTVDILTSLDKPITCESADKWITAKVESGSMNSMKLSVTVEENKTEKFRKGVVYLKQQITENEVIIKTLDVKQFGGLELSIYRLQIENGGGEETIEILTSYTPININLNNGLEWLNYRLDGRKLTIIAKPNQGGNRTAIVFISAWSKKKNQYVDVKLTVTQKGLVDASVKPEELSFTCEGGTEKVAVTMGNDVTFAGLKVSGSASSWIQVEKQSDHFNVTALPNNDSEREATVTATFTTKDASGKTITANLPVSIYQEGIGTAHVGEGLFITGTAYVHLYANGPEYFEDFKMNGVAIDVPGINDPQYKTLGYTIDRGEILSYRSKGYETEGDGEWSKVEYAWDMAMDINKGDNKSLYNYRLESGSVNVTKTYYQKNLDTKQLELVNTITCSYTLKDFNHTSVSGIGNGGVLEFYSDVDPYDTETKLSDFINNVTYNEYGKKGNWSYSSGDLIETKWADDHHENWYFNVKLYLTEGTQLLEPDKTLIQFEDGHSAYETVRYSHNDLVSDITITSSADWITIDEAGGYFHVTVPNNTSQADRTGYVYLSGKLADGSTLTRTITVKQPYTRIWDDRWETSTSEKAELPSKEIQEMLESHGMALYTDDEPPAVNGVFEVKPAMLQYSSNPEGGQAGDVFEGSFVFNIESMLGEKPRARLGIYQQSDEYGPMPADEYVCYLGGSDNQFTISNIFTETDDNPLGIYTYTHITIVSGEVEGNTIKNLQYAQVFLDENGKVEDVYISTDSDGVSTPTAWEPGKGWDEQGDDDNWDARKRRAFATKRFLRLKR